MALPRSNEARLYYRAAYQRFADAEFLLSAGRTTGAVYLAGYGVECILKALILDGLPDDTRRAMVQTFRGARAHDFEWLRHQLLATGGATIPPDVGRHLIRVNTWSTDVRYETGAVRTAEARAFLDSAAAVIGWANGRL